MNAPEGYTELDLVGFTDKGPYSATAEYVKNDIVHYDNSLWRCLVDDTKAVTPAEGTSWTLFMQAADSLAAMTAIDTAGVLGTAGAAVGAQDLMDGVSKTALKGGNLGLTVKDGKLCAIYSTNA